MKEKTPLSHEAVCFQMLHVETSIANSDFWGLENKFMENYFFLKNYATSEGAVSHNILFYQPLSITRHQVRFYSNNYFK